MNNNINLYTGQTVVPIQLASLAGRNGLDVSISLGYNSNVQQEAVTWNLDAPTGVVGLGWNLPFETIFVEQNYTGNTSDDSFYMVSGGQSGRLFCVGTDSSGALLYEMENYAFWKISYSPTSETWTVIRENGDSYIFGEDTSQRNTIQWGVKWNNWLGSSKQTVNQKQIALAWNLSRITNRFNDEITYAYNNIDVATGVSTGLLYTQASYLSKITGVYGSYLQFNYQQKTSDEYQDPNTNPAPPNAFQNCFETCYLSSVDAYSPNDTLLSTSNLSYLKSDSSPAFLGSGQLTKRLLTGVSTKLPEAPGSLPGIGFTYWGQDSTDQVTNTNLFNSSNGALYGSIKSITVPEGGIETYTYAQLKPAFSNRQSTLTAPLVSGLSFSNPKCYFSDGYTIVSWLGSDTAVYLKAYTWDGRWLSQDLGSIPLASALAYDTLNMALSDAFFAVYSENQMHLYYQDITRAGEWIQPIVSKSGTTQNYFSCAFTTGEEVKLVVGDQIAALLGTSSGKLYRFNWNGSAWISLNVLNPAGSSTNLSWAIGSENNYLICTYTSQTTSSDSLHISIWYLDQSGAWQGPKTFSKTRPFSSVSSIKLWTGKTFAAVRIDDNLGGSNTADYNVWWWNESFSSLSNTDFGTIDFGSESAADMIINGSFIAVQEQFYRFDGKVWTSQNVSGLNPAGDGTLSFMSLSVDQAIRIQQLSNGNYLTDLLVYNPNTGGNTAWSIPSGMSESAEIAGISLTSDIENTNSNYVVFDNKLYYCSNNGTWSPTGLTLPDLSGNDALSVKLLESNYLIFQQNGNTNIYPLLNGSTYSETAIVISNQQIYAAGNELIGKQAFVSYTGTYGSSDSQLTLNRVLANAATGLLTSYVVSGKTSNNGYQNLYSCYQFDATTALGSYSGNEVFFHLAKEIPGQLSPASPAFGWTEFYFYNGLTTSESTGITYPTGDETNALDYYSIAQGFLYGQLTFPAGANQQDSEEINYLTVYPVTLGNMGSGFYSRILKTTKMLDQVNSWTKSTYSSETGFQTTGIVSNYNSNGDQELITSSYTYFWEIYDPSRSLNILNLIIQTSTSNTIGSTVTPVSTAVVVFQDDWGFGTGQWAPVKNYVAQQADASAFQSWFSTSPAPDSDWLLTSTVLSQDSYGNVLRSSNVLGVISGTCYNANSFFKVSVFTNADISADEASYYGFMSYENTEGWAWSGSGSIQSNLTTTDFHTGNQSLRLAPSQASSGITRHFQPGDQSKAYVFGLWVKTGINYVPGTNPAASTFSIYNAANNTLIETLSLAVPQTNGVWLYQQELIDFPAILLSNNLPSTTVVYLRIKVYNPNTTDYCLIDNLRFSPVDADFNAIVYDPLNLTITATLDNNGQTGRIIYDVYKRVMALVGPGESVKSLNAFSYSSQQVSGDGFSPQFPNTSLQLSTTSDSLYYDFHDTYTAYGTTDSAWVYSGDDDDEWEINGGELVFSGSSSGPVGCAATLTVFAFTNFSVQIYVAENSGNVGISNGDLIVYWDTSANSNLGGWTIARYINGGGISGLQVFGADKKFGTYLIFTIIDNLLSFFADGVQICNYYITDPNTTAPNYGFPTLVCNDTTHFDDLVVLNNPQISMNFTDGFGNPAQQIALSDCIADGETPQYQLLGTGSFRDQLGRVLYKRNPACPKLEIDLNETCLVIADEDTYLVNSEGDKESEQNYLNGTDGFDYTTISYEKSPLSRLTSSILPRSSDATESNFTIKRNYAAANATVVDSDVLPSSVVGNYYMQCITDQNGNKTYLISDQLGRQVAQLAQQDGSGYNTTKVIYSPAGLPVIEQMPNYFQPPVGSLAESWQKINTYTFSGLPYSIQTPDTGTAYFIYDNAGRIRFTMDANGAGATLNGVACQRINYVKYDKLNRVIEEGYIQDSNYQWGEDGADFQSKANSEDWPVIESSGVQGKWSKKRHYDYDPANTGLLYLLGRLRKTEINNNDSDVNPDTETLSYDDEGNVITNVTSVLSSSANTWTTEYKYNNMNQVCGIFYPYTAGQTNIFKVGYYFNRLGQLASVGNVIDGNEVYDPENPINAGENLYAAFSYNPDGSISNQLFNSRPDGDFSFNRNMSYNPEGWLTSISDPFCEENLSYYDEAGYANKMYYNGNISQAAFTYKPETNLFLPETRYAFAYDKLNRITAAQNQLGSAYSFLWGSTDGSTPGYDANGNILIQQRGAVSNSFNYKQVNTENTVNNRLLNVYASAASSLNITTDTASNSIGDWSWGSNNSGPSTSAVVDKSNGSGKCLQLSGGSIGHYELLELTTYLSPTGLYNISYQFASPTGFSAQAGDAGWYLVIASAKGTYLELPLEKITDTGGAWQTATLAQIDLPAVLASLSLGEELVSVSLQVRNGKLSDSGYGPGKAFQINNISLTSAQSSSGNYSYDANGNVIESLAKSVYNIQYDPISGLTTSMNIGSNSGQVLGFSYGAQNQRTFENLTSDGVSSMNRLYINGMGANPLMEITTSEDSSKTAYYIYGSGGLIAFVEDDNLRFVLNDHLGSTRVIVNSDKSVDTLNDFLPYGGLMRTQGTSLTDYLFTGQELDAPSSLYNYKARMYDPGISRFYASDPMQQFAASYAYSSQPNRFTDPSGMFFGWDDYGAMLIGGTFAAVGETGRQYFFDQEMNSNKVGLAFAKGAIAAEIGLYTAGIGYYLGLGYGLNSQLLGGALTGALTNSAGLALENISNGKEHSMSDYLYTAASGAFTGSLATSVAWTLRVYTPKFFSSRSGNRNFNKQVGIRGEKFAKEILRSHLYRDFEAIQSASGHGIDMTAKRGFLGINIPGSLRYSSEIKGHLQEGVLKLSKDQANPVSFILSRAKRALGWNLDDFATTVAKELIAQKGAGGLYAMNIDYALSWNPTVEFYDWVTKQKIS